MKHIIKVCGEVYSIQNYVIKIVSDLRQVGGFLRVLQFPPPIKLTESHNIIEILLKVALNTITLIKQIIILTTVLVLSYNSKSFVNWLCTSLTALVV
jgi:hypothetical protein